MFSLAYNFPTTKSNSSKFCRKKYLQIKWISRQKKLHRKKYVEMTWIFLPSKLHGKKCVETTWIFRSAKLHRKSTWKRRGNSSKFGLRRIDVISTSNRRRFDVVCPLGNFSLTLVSNIPKQTSLQIASIEDITPTASIYLLLTKLHDAVS